MKNKIGIVLPFQNGDLITATSCLRYKEELWGDVDIVWFCNEPHSDALKFQDIEIRYFPHGWDILENDITGQYAERVRKDKAEGKPDWEDWVTIKNSDNKLIQELKSKFKSFEDLHEAYFPAPWMLTPTQRHGLEYPLISKKVFGVPDDLQWHPVLKFSEEERIMAVDFMDDIPPYKTIAIESFAGSSQSKITDIQVIDAMDICRRVLGRCNFILMSHKFVNGNEKFPEGLINNEDVFSAAHFTVRQCALIVGMSNLLISVSSGIAVAASCWENQKVPIIQYCGSNICSTQALALGRFELITTDGKTPKQSWNEFETKLTEILNEIK